MNKNNYQEKTYRIEGLDCAEEVKALRKTVGRLDGIENLDFNVISGTMTVTFDDSKTDNDAIQAGIKNAGLKGHTEGECCGGSNNRDKTTDSWWKKHGRACLCIVSGLLFSTVLVLVVIPLIYYASVRSQPVVLS